jgi:hypothetical protein
MMILRTTRLVFAAAAPLALSSGADAADHGQFGRTSPEIKAWANSLENKLKEGCCSTADGWRPEAVEYDIKDDRYRVKIEGQWYEVPAMAVIEGRIGSGFPSSGTTRPGTTVSARPF